MLLFLLFFLSFSFESVNQSEDYAVEKSFYGIQIKMMTIIGNE